MSGPHFDRIKYYSVTPTLDTSAYAAADQMGTLNTITDVGEYTRNVGLVGLTIVDKDKEKAAFDILFFNQTTAIASSDNAALDITDALLATNYLGHVSVLTTDYVDLANGSIACIPPSRLGHRFEMASTGNDLFFILRCGSTPTYTAASDLVIKLAFKSG